METTYSFWAHKASGEVWAIRQVGEQITGVCGVLCDDEIKTALLPDYDYSDEDMEWWTTREDEFRLYENAPR